MYQSTVVGPNLEIGQNVRLLVEGALKQGREPALTLLQSMLVQIVLERQKKLKLVKKLSVSLLILVQVI